MGLGTFKTIDSEFKHYVVRGRVAPFVGEEPEEPSIKTREVGHFDQCTRWLGILNTFRTLYYEEIISFKHKIEELNLEFA